MSEDILAYLDRCNGKGCRCGAWGRCECACDGPLWPDDGIRPAKEAIITLRTQLAEVKAERDRLDREYSKANRLLGDMMAQRDDFRTQLFASQERERVAREGLEAVIDHQKTIGGSLSPMSATVGIAATTLARIDAMKEKETA